MHPRLLSQAQMRLKLCDRAFEELKKVIFEEEEFQLHWQDFLVQWKGAYMKVQQAAKISPQEMQWFGKVNAIRRNDPLLRWLYEARNDEEHHGLADTATRKPGEFVFKLLMGGPGETRIEWKSPTEPEMIDVETGKPAGILESYTPEEAKLKEVTEYDGKRKIPPPETHYGKPIPSDPKVAAYLGLRWLTALLSEAEALHNS